MKKGKRLFKFVPMIGEKPQFSCIGYENVHCQSNNKNYLIRLNIADTHTHSKKKTKKKTKQDKTQKGLFSLVVSGVDINT